LRESKKYVEVSVFPPISQTKI